MIKMSEFIKSGQNFYESYLSLLKQSGAQTFILPRLPCLEEVLKTRCKKCITNVGYILQSSEKTGPKRNFTLKLNRVLIAVLGFAHAIKNLLTYSLSFETLSYNKLNLKLRSQVKDYHSIRHYVIGLNPHTI